MPLLQDWTSGATKVKQRPQKVPGMLWPAFSSVRDLIQNLPEQRSARFLLLFSCLLSSCSNLHVGLLEVTRYHEGQVSMVSVKSLVEVRCHAGDAGGSLGPRRAVYFLENQNLPEWLPERDPIIALGKHRTFIYNFSETKILAKATEITGVEFGLSKEFIGIFAGHENRVLLSLPGDQDRSYIFNFEPDNLENCFLRILNPNE